MELELSYPRKYNDIVLSEIQRLGFVCGDPIPLHMGDKSPNGKWVVFCHSDKEVNITDAYYDVSEETCRAPWFLKDEMVLRIDYGDGYLQYPSLRLYYGQCPTAI